MRDYQLCARVRISHEILTLCTRRWGEHNYGHARAALLTTSWCSVDFILFMSIFSLSNVFSQFIFALVAVQSRRQCLRLNLKFIFFIFNAEKSEMFFMKMLKEKRIKQKRENFNFWWIFIFQLLIHFAYAKMTICSRAQRRARFAL